MIKVNLRKKGLIGISLALALCIAGVGAYNLKAAERVDTEKNVTITANVVDDNSVFATSYKGDVVINLYKIAALNEAGTLQKVDGYEGVNLSVLPTEVTDKDATVQEITEGIVNPAMNSRSANPDGTITIKRGANEKSGTASFGAGAGLYLFVPEMTVDERYSYYFTPYVILAPGSDYISLGNGSDKWNYEVNFNLKVSEEPRYGRLKISKKLDTYNVSLGDVSFVYEVKAVLDGETVKNNVYALTLTKEDFTETNTVERIIDDIFPATATVTVTEKYTGASYDAVQGDVVETVEIIADDIIMEDLETAEERIATAYFENEFNGKNIIGGIAAENLFVEDGNGGYEWVNPNPEVR